MIKQTLAKYAFGAYITAVAFLPVAQYITEGRQTGQWNPIKQEWKPMESLTEFIFLDRAKVPVSIVEKAAAGEGFLDKVLDPNN